MIEKTPWLMVMNYLSNPFEGVLKGLITLCSDSMKFFVIDLSLEAILKAEFRRRGSSPNSLAKFSNNLEFTE